MNKNANDLCIRMAEPDDAFTLLGIYEPYVENTCITFEYQVPSQEEFTKRIRETLKKYPQSRTAKSLAMHTHPLLKGGRLMTGLWRQRFI